MKTGILTAVLAAALTFAAASPATAMAAEPAAIGLSTACQAADRVTYKDLRTLIDIDLDTATEAQVRLRVNQVASTGILLVKEKAEAALGGTAEDRRRFLKEEMPIIWADDLRVLTTRTLNGAGQHVHAAASTVLTKHTVDTLLEYLNVGQHAARELDYRALTEQALTTGGPEVKKAAAAALQAGTFEAYRVFLCSGWLAAHDQDLNATPTPSPSADALPTTGTNTSGLALAGLVLVLGGAAAVAVSRRRRA